MIVGRTADRSRLNRLIADAKAGRGRVLVLHVRPGSVNRLLDYAVGVAGGTRVIRVAGTFAPPRIRRSTDSVALLRP